MRLYRKSSLGDVVLLGAVTGALPGCTVITAPPYVELARRLKGVGAVEPWSDPVDGVDLQTRRCWGPRRRNHTLRRKLWQMGLAAPRASVPELYARACGVNPQPLPWIEVPPRTRDTLAVVPGASRPTKQWSVREFQTLVRAWSGPVVVLGGPEEEALCAEVAGDHAQVLCEKGFDRTIDALAGVRVAVGGDTGLMHLAGACGSRLVALFGPTHPDDGFFVYPGRVVQRSLRCRPCSLHGAPSCPLGEQTCLSIPAAEVWAAVNAEWACAG